MAEPGIEQPAVTESPSDRQLLARLARAEGQVRGVAHMVEADRGYVEVLTQIGAARAALDAVALELIGRRLRQSARRNREDPDMEKVELEIRELIDAVARVYAH